MEYKGYKWDRKEETGKTINSPAGGKHLCSFRNKDKRRGAIF